MNDIGICRYICFQELGKQLSVKYVPNTHPVTVNSILNIPLGQIERIVKLSLCSTSIVRTNVFHFLYLGLRNL